MHRSHHSLCEPKASNCWHDFPVLSQMSHFTMVAASFIWRILWPAFHLFSVQSSRECSISIWLLNHPLSDTRGATAHITLPRIHSTVPFIHLFHGNTRVGVLGTSSRPQKQHLYSLKEFLGLYEFTISRCCHHYSEVCKSSLQTRQHCVLHIR